MSDAAGGSAAAPVAVKPTAPAKNTSPEYSASFFSRWLFLWTAPLFTRGQKKVLDEADMYDVAGDDEVAGNSAKFEAYFDEALKAGHPSPVKAATYRLVKPIMIRALMVKMLNSTIQFGPPLLLNGLLAAVQEHGLPAEQRTWWENAAWLFAAGLFVVSTVRCIVENVYFHAAMRAGFRVRAAISTAVFRKALRMSPVARQETPVGQIVNLMQLDASRLEGLMTQLCVLVDSPYQVVGYMVLLLVFLGPSALAGLATMLILIPINGAVMKTTARYRRMVAKENDARIKITNEILQGIRALKYYSWERAFERTLKAVRDKELWAIWRYSAVGAVNSTLMQTAPVIVSIVTFLVYAGSGGDFTAARIFSSLAAFAGLRFPLMFFPGALQQMADARVSFERLNRFMTQPEVERYAMTDAESAGAPEAGIKIADGTFMWEKPEDRELRLKRKEEDARKAAEAKAKAAAKAAKGRCGCFRRRGAKAAAAASSAPAAKAAAAVGGAGTGAAAAPAPASAPAPSSVSIPPVLSGINVTIPRGQLWAVIGPVGSGKSALIQAILGELSKQAGSVQVHGRVAYVSQTAWILNASVRRNVVFAYEANHGGATLDEGEYQSVLDTCQLVHDISTLPAGDATEIGERGVNLSGGQRQRVALARAAASGADTYLLDDVLSALDAEVGKAVFEHVIAGRLAGKTRLMVTNQLQYLRACDGIIALGKGADGQGIVEYQGTFAQLMELPAFAEMMAAYGADAAAKEAEAAAAAAASETAAVTPAADGAATPAATPVAGKKAAPTKAAPAAGSAKLMTVEERKEGAVAFKYYTRYLRSAGWVALTMTILAFAYTASQASMLVSQWWLTYWTSDSKFYIRHDLGFYMGIYVALGIASAIVAFIRVIVMALMGIRASRNIHTELLRSVMEAPLSFFDTTPLGRLLSRFAKDIDNIDNQLVSSLGMFIMCIFWTAGSIGAIIFATPWFAVGIPVLLIVYVKTMNYFRAVARSVKRVENVLRSPCYQHFSEALGGLSVIRAYGLGPEFISQNEEKTSRSIGAWYTLRSCDRWLSVRLETLGNVIILAAALLVVGTGSSRGQQGSAAGLGGFSLSYAMSVTGLLNWLVRVFAELEQTMNSVERVTHYADTVPAEPYAPPAGSTPPPPTWPTTGSVEFSDYRMRYRPSTPEILHGVSFKVNGGEKVGICGRTGAGKSTIMLSIFRFIEQECRSGKIRIDGVDIDTLGLEQLREHLAIIPQDPVMFSGTIRSNLDPVGSLASLPDHGDSKLWGVLEQVGLKDTIARLPGGLDEAVVELGSNFSVGQRQLLCLARVLLRKAKVVMLDEASSSLSFADDLALQATLRTAFKDVTVLTIAHRLNTIIDSDRVLVLDGGLVAEFDSPHALLSSQEGTIFASLIDEMGPEAAAALRAQAKAAAEARAAAPARAAAATEVTVADAGAASSGSSSSSEAADPAAVAVTLTA